MNAGRLKNVPDWAFWDYSLIALAGKTMGIIGFGRIGQTIGRFAGALEMHVLAAGSRETETGRKVAEYTDPGMLLNVSAGMLRMENLKDSAKWATRE